METFQPLINVLIVMTVLSAASERFANLLKLQRDRLRGAARQAMKEARAAVRQAGTREGPVAQQCRAAEKLARKAGLRLQRVPTDPDEEPARDEEEEAEVERASAITARAFLVGVTVAVLTKADMFAILRHVDAPWITLGWAGNTTSLASADGMQIVLGCIIMGAALGFGSQFWHDILHLVLDTRNKLKAARDENPRG